MILATPTSVRYVLQPLLPPHYELISIDQVDSVVAEATRRAVAGADEGTLVFAAEQTDARTAKGKPWDSPRGNLHCAVVLRPDFSVSIADQLNFVCAISAGAAIAELVTAMTGLRFRWPNQITINDLSAGRVEIAAPANVNATEPPKYLICALMLNVEHHPPNPEPERFNSIHASGAHEVSCVELLEGFARHFLRWINRWAEDGFEPIRQSWMQRADGLDGAVQFTTPTRPYCGTASGIADNGALVLSVNDQRYRVTVAEYFGLGA